MIKPNRKVFEILDSICYATIATVGKDGEPWNTPVGAFRFKDEPTLYWTSWRDNQHSRNIRDNGRAFVVIYDSTPTGNEVDAGVYMSGRAYELYDEQEVARVASLFEGDPYNSSDGSQYRGTHLRRIYKFVPDRVWLSDYKEIDGDFVDVRKEALEY